MSKEYSMDDIIKALDSCPKHEVEVKTPKYIDGDLDTTIVTVEVKYFLWHLSHIKPNER